MDRGTDFFRGTVILGNSPMGDIYFWYEEISKKPVKPEFLGVSDKIVPKKMWKKNPQKCLGGALYLAGPDMKISALLPLLMSSP